MVHQPPGCRVIGAVVTTPPNGSMSTSTRFAFGAQTRISLSVIRSRQECYRKAVEYAGQGYRSVADDGAPGQQVGPRAGRNGDLVVAPAVERAGQARDDRHHLVTGRV